MLRKLEGFEGVRIIAQLARHYAVGTGTIATEIGHRGNNNAVASTNLVLRTNDLLDGATDENVWVLGFALRVTNGTISAGQTVHPWAALRSSAGEQLRFDLIPSVDTKPGGVFFKLRVSRGATVLATSVERFRGSISENLWTYFELKATVRTGTNGSFSARYHTRRDKNVAVTWDAANTGLNTANQGADGADRVEISLANNSTVTLALDNVYACDGSGSVNNDFLGELEIEAIDVTGDGATDQWDENGGAASLEDAWNEAATVQNTDEDDKRLTTKDVGDISLAALGNPVLNRFVGIVGVETRIVAKMEASGTRDVQFFYRKTTGSPAQVGTKIVSLLGTTLVGHEDVRETDPNTSAAWVVADIDGLQAGVELDA
jgi:hypothetical protein